MGQRSQVERPGAREGSAGQPSLLARSPTLSSFPRTKTGLWRGDTLQARSVCAAGGSPGPTPSTAHSRRSQVRAKVGTWRPPAVALSRVGKSQEANSALPAVLGDGSRAPQPSSLARLQSGEEGWRAGLGAAGITLQSCRGWVVAPPVAADSPLVSTTLLQPPQPSRDGCAQAHTQSTGHSPRSAPARATGSCSTRAPRVYPPPPPIWETEV